MLSHPLLTVHDVADLLQVKEATVRTWINDNSLRAVKFGKEWRVARKDLEAFVESHANRPANTASSGDVADSEVQPKDPEASG